MQRFSLLLGLIALSVTLGLLWRTEGSQQPLTVAEAELERPPHLEQLLSEMSWDEREDFLRQFQKAQDNPRPRQVRIIKLDKDDSHPFLFPTDQMYRQIPQFETPVQRR